MNTKRTSKRSLIIALTVVMALVVGTCLSYADTSDIGKAKATTPKGTSITSVTSVKNGQLTVKWKKGTSVTGYQLRYATDSSMIDAETVTIKGIKNVTKKLTGLEKGKKYYVQVGTYKTVKGQKVASAWSKTKSATVMNAYLSATKLEVKKGGSAKLTVKGAAGKKVKWSTSKKTIATVSTGGKIVGKKTGTATITAKVGEQKLTCKVSVVEIPVINKTKASIYVGATTTLKITGTSKKATWKSSDKSVATVSSKGVVKAKKAGKATITAKVAGKEVSCVVTVKNRVSVSHSELVFEETGEKTIQVTFVGSGWISIDSSDLSIVKGRFDGGWKGNTTDVILTALKPGTAEVKFRNELNNEVHAVKVIVKAPWDKIEVVIPETLGDKENPGNRMVISEYRFSKYNDSTYWMNVYFTCVQKKVDVNSWSEYFYCYDKDGNMIKKCWMNGPSFVVGGTYGGPVTIPVETAKIVFEEYPEVVEPEVPDDPADPEDPKEPEEPDDDTLWTYNDYSEFKKYINKAAECVKLADDCLSRATTANGAVYKSYCTMAVQNHNSAKSYYKLAYDVASKKKAVNLIDGDGNPDGTLTDKLTQTMARFDILNGLDCSTNEAFYTISDLSLALIPDKVLYQKIILDMAEAFN